MTGEVLGFVQAGQLGYALQGLDYDVVSTVAFFSLVGQADGSLNRNNPGWRAWASSQMTQVIAKAHATGTRVVFSLQGFSWSPDQTAVSSSILSTAANRERLASQAAAEVRRRGVDGIDVDFEPIPPGQASQFTDFVHRLRVDLNKLDPNYQLTVAVVGHYDTYDIPGLIAPGGADAIYLMGYHWAGWWSKLAGSTAPYGGSGYDVKAAIAGLLESVPPSRLIVGMPYYGHLWPTTSAAPRAATTGEGVDLIYTDAMAVAQANGLKHEPGQDAAWSVFQSRDCTGCALHWNQLYFDDATSLSHKWAYLKGLGLLGTGVWTLPFEGAGGGPLDAAMRKAFLAAR